MKLGKRVVELPLSKGSDVIRIEYLSNRPLSKAEEFRFSQWADQAYALINDGVFVIEMSVGPGKHWDK